MPTVKFTTRWIDTNAKPPAHGQVDYIDSSLPGFTLRVTAKGVKTWTLCYYFHKRRRRLTLGRYPSVPLAKARTRALSALAKISAGADPVRERQLEARQGTFSELQTQYLAKFAKPTKKEKSWKNDEWILRRHLLPPWKHLKAADITRADVRALIEPIATTTPVLANRVLALISSIFKFAVNHDWRPDNPARGVEWQPESGRKRLLNDDEIRRVWSALDEEDPFFQALFKLRFLTAARGVETRTMRWSDLDLHSRVWTIPEERAKNGNSNTVPLTALAVELIQRLQQWQQERIESINVGRRKKKWDLLAMSEWVFPSPRHSGYFEWEQRAAQRIRDRSGVDFGFHDVRRTVSTALTKTCKVDRFILKRIINHVDQDVTDRYDLNNYEVAKRVALEQWERKLLDILRGEPQTANVLPMMAANS